MSIFENDAADHEPPYDWATDWEGKIYVGIHADFDTIKEAQEFSAAAEDLVNRMNGEFRDSEIEPA